MQDRITILLKTPFSSPLEEILKFLVYLCPTSYDPQPCLSTSSLMSSHFLTHVFLLQSGLLSPITHCPSSGLRTFVFPFTLPRMSFLYKKSFPDHHTYEHLPPSTLITWIPYFALFFFMFLISTDNTYLSCISSH